MPRRWLNRALSTFLPFTSTRQLERHPRVLRSTIGSIGTLVVVVTCLAPPVAVLCFGYYYERQFVSILADMQAAQLAHRFTSDTSFSWSVMNRQRNAGESLAPHSSVRAERVVNNHGTVVRQIGVSPDFPTIVGKSQIVARGERLGQVEITTTLRPLLLFAALVSLASGLLGCLAYVLLRIFPLRVLDGVMARLQDRNWQLDAALSNVPLGIAMFDAERQLVIHNDHYRKMYQFPPGIQLVGQTADELNRIRLEAGTYGNISADEFRRERDMAFGSSAVRLQKMGDGRIIEVAQRSTQIAGVVITHQDVSERERLHSELMQREEQLRVALGNMVQGLAMFDAEQRIVVANPVYAEMYGLNPDAVAPGTTLRQIIERRLAAGTYGDVADREEFIATCLGEFGQSLTKLIRLADGRVILNVRRPMPNGGLITTHEDVTDREQLNERLIEKNRLLEARENELAIQNLLFQTALENMPQGLCMFDAHDRVMVANDRYAEVYGLSPAQCQPGTAARAIVAHRVANGSCEFTDVDHYMRNRRKILDGLTQGQTSTRLQRLTDGRVITISHRRMVNGGLICTTADITERELLSTRLQEQNRLLEAQEQALQLRNHHFDIALSNIVQGLCLFDAEQHLIVANHRFAEIYGLTAEQVKAGTTFRQILEQRIASGVYPCADKEEYIRERLSGAATEAATRTHVLSDGRSISIKHVPLKEGGWVATHEDVTEHQKLADELATRNKLLHQNEVQLLAKNAQLDAALNNMTQGLAMFDAERRLVVANHRYALMYKLPPELMKPGTDLAEILSHRASDNLLPRGGIGVIEEMIRVRFERGAASKGLIDLVDGREIEIQLQPADDGGWVATHEDVTEERRVQARILHMAGHDALTDLPNRTLLSDRLTEALGHVGRGSRLALHFMDLDDFKGINDTLGHSVGDKLLQATAERLQRSIRKTDAVGRLGGDEFAVIQIGLEGPDDAASFAQKLIDALREPFEIDGHQIEMRTSIGIALAPADGQTAEQLLRNADLALYQAKEMGRATYRFFEPALEERMQKRRALEADLRKALAAGQLELHYQPFVSVDMLQMKGVEALMRWQHPERGTIPPADFIPLAEDAGLIIPIGAWALREACATVAQWPGDVCVAVNLSPVQFRNPGLVHTVVGALADSGLNPRRLELEITESLLLDASDLVIDALHELRALGVKISLDDFGTGYSSLSYLQSFPFDKIKIDRAFIKNLGVKPTASDIVKAIVAMAHALDMSITAEGVETEQQLATTREIGCTDFQGYLFSRPRPAAEIELMLLFDATAIENAA